MWEFYLAISEMSFRYGGFMVFQMQLATGIDSVPLTRNYLYQAGAEPFYGLPASIEPPCARPSLVIDTPRAAGGTRAG